MKTGRFVSMPISVNHSLTKKIKSHSCGVSTINKISKLTSVETKPGGGWEPQNLTLCIRRLFDVSIIVRPLFPKHGMSNVSTVNLT